MKMINRIREVRKQQELSMKKLGEMVGVAESTISQYERGIRQPDLETILKISNALNVTVGYLIGDDEQKENPAVPSDSEVDARIWERWEQLTEQEKQSFLAQIDAVLKLREQ